MDTNIASYLMRSRPSIVARVNDVGGAGLLSISTITLAELRYGIHIMPEGRRRSSLLKRLEDMLAIGMDIRPFTIAAADVYSEAGATLRNAGIAFSFQDLAIAAIAMSENKTLASNDGFFTHMRRLRGLRFERWEP